ncbi:MAG: hypothetical protein LUD00_00905 [Prevotellaceae bacterium]|nr:hypothetical protein [Prevotellaceae bacterium]
MSKIIEDMLRETREQAEREAMLEVLESGERSVADIAYADDLTEEEVRRICEENSIPIPQCEDYINIPKTPTQAEALLREVMANTVNYPSIEYYAAKMLKLGLVDKNTAARICMLSKAKADELENASDEQIKELRHAKTYHAEGCDEAEKPVFVQYRNDEYEVNWRAVPIDTWVEERSFLRHDTGSDRRTRYHFAGVYCDGSPMVYSIGTSWTNGGYGSKITVNAEDLYLVKREDFEKYAKKRQASNTAE